MRRLPIPRPVHWALLPGLALLLTAPAEAGVPRSCIHPQADPIACARDQREALLERIPSARRRALRDRRPALERVGERESLRRNRLIEEVLGELRAEPRPIER